MSWLYLSTTGSASSCFSVARALVQLQGRPTGDLIPNDVSVTARELGLKNGGTSEAQQDGTPLRLLPCKGRQNWRRLHPLRVQ